MAPALQEISVAATVGQYSRLFGLFARQLPLALPLGPLPCNALPGSG
ncbi:hypothetical protein [uncultured Tateyamaria sp.]|nr:hypothetical protein [uncultured Tateyamaria sp.]